MNGLTLQIQGLGRDSPTPEENDWLDGVGAFSANEACRVRPRRAIARRAFRPLSSRPRVVKMGLNTSLR